MARRSRKRLHGDGLPGSMFSPFIDVVMNGFAAIAVILCLFILFSAPPVETEPLRLVCTGTPLQLVDRASFVYVLGATGGTGKRTFALAPAGDTPLPEWFRADEAGVLAGIARGEGRFRVRASVRDADGKEVQAEFDVEVLPTAIPWHDDQRLRLTLESDDIPPARVGVPYEVTLGASGGVPPLHWQIVEIREGDDRRPSGLSCSEGRISGTPLIAGLLQFRATVTHTPGSFEHGGTRHQWTGAEVERTYRLRVLDRASIVIRTEPVRAGGAVLVTADTGALRGDEHIEWSTAPADLRRSDSGHVLHGSLIEARSYDLAAEIRWRDQVLAQDTGNLVVLPAQPRRFDAVVFQAWLGEPIDYALPCRGMEEPVQARILDGELPPGIETRGGAVAGSATQTGLFTARLRLTDVRGTLDGSVTIRVGPRY